MTNRGSANAQAGADKSGSARRAPQQQDPTDLAGGEEAILDKIREAMQGIEFGSVLIKIHQGEVVGIESTRKARLRDAPGEPS
jgi:hypothetical protein